MSRFAEDIIQFFQKQGFVIVSTCDSGGNLHNSCKGIVKINRSGKVYLLDLYQGRTFENLQHNAHIAITAVDEHRFRGYSLKGKAKIIKGDGLNSRIIAAWEKRVSRRITQRVLKNIGGEKGHPRHPEVLLPKPEYMIVMEASEMVDLTPVHLKKGEIR